MSVGRRQSNVAVGALLYIIMGASKLPLRHRVVCWVLSKADIGSVG